MPDGPDDWLDLARRGGAAAHFERHAPPAAMAPLLAALPGIDDDARRMQLLQALVRMATARRDIKAALSQPQAAKAVCAALAAEPLEPLAAQDVSQTIRRSMYTPMPASARESARATGRNAIFHDYEDLLQALAPAADDALRLLLAGPLLPSQGQHGAKISAFFLVGSRLRPGDAAWLSALARDPSEPLRVREEAALAWLRLDPDDAARVAAVLLATDAAMALTSWGSRQARDQAFAEGGAPLVPHLIAHLADQDRQSRVSAGHLLGYIGAPAVAGLAEVVRAGRASPPLLAAAEALLAYLDIGALRAARIAADRHLSQAGRRRDEDGGLSRAAPE